MPLNFRIPLVIALFTAAFLLTTGCSKKNDITGAWKGKIILPETGKSLTELEFSLKQEGKEVSGTMIFTKPGSRIPLTGTVSEGKIALSSPMKDGLAVSITAAIADRKTIKGNAALDYDTPQLGKRQDKTVLEMTR